MNKLTVDTTAVPNLANRGNRAGKSNPLSQIVTPPVIGPDSGFTSVRVGTDSPSALGRAIGWLGGLMASSGMELEPAPRGGTGGGTSPGELDPLSSRDSTTSGAPWVSISNAG